MDDSEERSILEKLAPRERTLITSIDVKDLTEALKAKRDLIDYYETRHEKIERLFKRREFILNARYFHILQQLEDVKKAFELYRMTISNIERELKASPIIVKLLTEMRFYADYMKILEVENVKVGASIEEEEKRIDTHKKTITKKADLLKKKNKHNLDLATKINRLTALLKDSSSFERGNHSTEPPGLDEIKHHLTSSQQLTHDILTRSMKSLPTLKTNLTTQSPPPMREYTKINSSLNHSTQAQTKKFTTNRSVSLIRMPKSLNTSETEYESLYRICQAQIKRNNNIKANILTKISNQNKLYDLFLECFHYYENLVHKTQKIAKGQNLSGSLIFLLMNSKQKNLKSMSPVSIKDTSQLEKKSYAFKAKPYVKESEYEILDSMYKAFKNMIDKNQEVDRVQILLNTVTKQHIDAFTAIQMMGLLLLRPELLREIIIEFEEKSRKMVDLSTQLKKTKVSAEI